MPPIAEAGIAMGGMGFFALFWKIATYEDRFPSWLFLDLMLWALVGVFPFWGFGPLWEMILWETFLVLGAILMACVWWCSDE